MINELALNRLTYKGGWEFVQQYLKKYSARESDADFHLRREITPCPPFAQVAVDEVLNSLYLRLLEIQRIGGDDTYQSATKGKMGGVDRAGSTMESFLREEVLPELAQAGSVGIYVQQSESVPLTRADPIPHPYLFIIRTEAVLEHIQEPGLYTFETVKLRISLPDIGNKRDREGVWEKVPAGVSYYETYRTKDDLNRAATTPVTSNIERIPFVWLKIPHPLMRNVSTYQVALLNIGSSDLTYCVKANFPFYVRQSNVASMNNRKTDGDDVPATPTGPMQGEEYPLNAEAPSFIYPSPEPLLASMKKQEQLKQEIREILRLNIASVSNVSADSKDRDMQGMEAGLATLAELLKKAEIQIAALWAHYMAHKGEVVISYPTQFSLKSDSDRLEEAGTATKLIDAAPSITYKRELSKVIARGLLSSKISAKMLQQIEDEIDAAKVIVSDPKDLQQYVVNGILSAKDAATAYSFPVDTTKEAEGEHLRRVTRTAEAQSKAAIKNGGVLGSNIGGDRQQAKDEKAEQRDPANQDKPETGQRGGGK
jgi:hypothetical protein